MNFTCFSLPFYMAIRKLQSTDVACMRSLLDGADFNLHEAAFRFTQQTYSDTS